MIMTTQKTNEIPINEYLKVSPPKVEQVKPKSAPNPVDYYIPVKDPVCYRHWAREEIANVLGWETRYFDLEEDIILKGISIVTFGLTSYRIVIKSLSSGISFRGVSGSGNGNLFIPIPDWLLIRGERIITYLYLGNPANDSICIAYIGIPRYS